MKNFLEMFTGSILWATAFLSPLQAMDEPERGHWNSIHSDNKLEILAWAASDLRDVKVRKFMPGFLCVCSEWNALFNDPKMNVCLTITPDLYGDVALPSDLRKILFVRSLTIKYDTKRLIRGLGIPEECVEKNVRNFTNIIREGLCNKPYLTVLKMDELPVSIFFEEYNVENLREGTLHDKGLSTRAPNDFSQKPYLAFFSHLAELHIGCIRDEYKARYLKQKFMSLPHLKIVYLGGKFGEIFNKEENKSINVEK